MKIKFHFKELTMRYTTIQKAAIDLGVDSSYIRKMIENGDLTPHKMDGYKRVYIDTKELEQSIKPINKTEEKIDLDRYLV